MYHQMKMIPNYPQRETLEVDSEDEDDESKRTIFCANLDQRVTEELLYEVFLQVRHRFNWTHLNCKQNIYLFPFLC